MSFLEMLDSKSLRKTILPVEVETPCSDCGRRDYRDVSATDEAADFFEDYVDAEMRWHHLIIHDYCADLIEAYEELMRIARETEGRSTDDAALGVLGELALSFYGLALQHVLTGQVGTSPGLRAYARVMSHN